MVYLKLANFGALHTNRGNEACFILVCNHRRNKIRMFDKIYISLYLRYMYE